jgi:hypothetical protein
MTLGHLSRFRPILRSNDQRSAQISPRVRVKTIPRSKKQNSAGLDRPVHDAPRARTRRTSGHVGFDHSARLHCCKVKPGPFRRCKSLFRNSLVQHSLNHSVSRSQTESQADLDSSRTETSPRQKEGITHGQDHCSRRFHGRPQTG